MFVLARPIHTQHRYCQHGSLGSR